MVKDLPQIIRIEEAITKAKVSQKKKAFLRDHIQKEGSVSLVAQAEGAGGGVYHQRNLDQQFWFGSGRVD